MAGNGNTLKIIIQRLDIQNELYEKWYSSNIFNPSEALILEHSAITPLQVQESINRLSSQLILPFFS